MSLTDPLSTFPTRPRIVDFNHDTKEFAYCLYGRRVYNDLRINVATLGSSRILIGTSVFKNQVHHTLFKIIFNQMGSLSCDPTSRILERVPPNCWVKTIREQNASNFTSYNCHTGERRSKSQNQATNNFIYGRQTGHS